MSQAQDGSATPTSSNRDRPTGSALRVFPATDPKNERLWRPRDPREARRPRPDGLYEPS
ncbi:MAG: hypothetical protein KC656_11520 [Myxococcales bacterium]|nr:hypothetical protein [Myxococcales bacterium]MCB9690491.1 hypothetical protein [Alphaproteobacteria bacterium]